MSTQKDLEYKFKDFISKDKNPFFCFRHNKEGIFTYLSENITFLLGFTPQEFQTSYLSSLTPNTINKLAVFNTEKALMTGEKQEPYTIEIYDKNLNRIRLNIYESPIIGENGVEGIEGIAKVLN